MVGALGKRLHWLVVNLGVLACCSTSSCAPTVKGAAGHQTAVPVVATAAVSAVGSVIVVVVLVMLCGRRNNKTTNVEEESTRGITMARPMAVAPDQRRAEPVSAWGADNTNGGTDVAITEHPPLKIKPKTSSEASGIEKPPMVVGRETSSPNRPGASSAAAKEIGRDRRPSFGSLLQGGSGLVVYSNQGSSKSKKPSLASMDVVSSATMTRQSQSSIPARRERPPPRRLVLALA
eukprot:m.31242 g.31242  ORF g.31242 m.31242 type:complete len:234 (-) comp9696_c0_seq1:49-750(-)